MSATDGNITGLVERHLKLIRNILQKYESVNEARIFGSRARGDHKQGSDIDIVLIGQVSGGQCALIKSDIEDTTIPFFTDVLLYDGITNPELKEKIANESILLYRKDDSVQGAGGYPHP